MLISFRFSMVALVAVIFFRPTFGQAFFDDFETYAIGSFPAGRWHDVGLVDPSPPNPPDPSATVQIVTNARGTATKALVFADATAPSSGIYTATSIASVYRMNANIRIDRFSDQATSNSADFPVAMGFGAFGAGVDPSLWRGAQVYASSFTGGWRMKVFGTNGTQGDYDLNLAAATGRWYDVRLDFNSANGVMRGRIFDGATGAQLTDLRQVISGWTSTDGLFDTALVFDSETSGGITRSNLAVVDNVGVPETSSLMVLAFGLVSLVALRKRLRPRVGRVTVLPSAQRHAKQSRSF